MLSTVEHEELKAKIKEFSHQAAELSNQSVKISKVNRKQGLHLMRQARDLPCLIKRWGTFNKSTLKRVIE